jgi:hypothetical protein
MLSPHPPRLFIQEILVAEATGAGATSLQIGRIFPKQDLICLQDLIWLLLLGFDQIEIDEEIAQATHREVDEEGEGVTNELDEREEEEI